MGRLVRSIEGGLAMRFGRTMHLPGAVGMMAVVALAMAAKPTPTAGQDPPSAADEVAGAKGNNAFAVDLYGRLREQKGNLFFSPESISTAFAMADAGARGETAAQMAGVFHFTLPQHRLH